MKIEKFNESKESEEKAYNELYNFVEMIVKKFFCEDEKNMCNYECFRNQKIEVELTFMVIEEDELTMLQKIIKYIRTFDKNSKLLFLPFNNKFAGSQIICKIEIGFINYKKMYKDLEMYKTAKKYNL